MINLNNYATLAEQKKYGYLVTESIDVVNEAAPDMQTEDGVKKVLGGKTDPNYVNQWNQLVDDVATRKAAGTYTVTINHDDNRPMVTLQYQIGSDLKPVKGSVKLSATTAQAAQGQPAGANAKVYTDSELQSNVKYLVNELDGWVDLDNLKNVQKVLNGYVNQFATADDDTTKVTAIGRILTLYKRDENGDTLPEDISGVGTSTLPAEAEKIKTQLSSLLKPYKEQ
jgi:hypothetical protein